MKLFLILGNQLFDPKYLKNYRDHSFFMCEDYGLCTYEKHHKLKILLFLSSMRSYSDELKAKKFNVNYLQQLSYNQWAIVVIVFSVLGSLLFLLFYFADAPTLKRFYFVTSSVSFILLITALIITFNQYSISKNNTEAIVFVEKVEVRNAPTFNSEEVFTLHEGTKVLVLDAVDNWKKIRLADGKIGWIISEKVKEL